MYIYVCICMHIDRQQSDILFYRGTVNDRFKYRICIVSGWSMDVSDPEQLSVHHLQPNGVILHPIHSPPNQRLPKKSFFSSILFLFYFFTSSLFLLLPLFSSLSLFSSHIPLIPRVLSATYRFSSALAATSTVRPDLHFFPGSEKQIDTCFFLLR